MALQIRPASECAQDQVSLGEILVCYRPSNYGGRIVDADTLLVDYGGGEFNASVGVKRLGLRSAVCTAIVNNRVGQNLLGFIRRVGVGTDFIKLREFDGIGRACRNATYYAESGYGVRGGVAEFDRGYTAASQLKPGDFDWEYIFGKLGVRWFHTGGIFAGISATTAPLIIEAARVARKHGVVVSFDLNYREKLWQAIGGQERAQEVNREIIGYVNVVFGNEEDYGKCLGFKVEGLDPDMLKIETGAFQAMIRQVVTTYPNLEVAATTLRRATTASTNDWHAILWHNGRFYESRKYPALEIYDRIGMGDSFASGAQFAFMKFNDPQKAVDWGAANGAFAATTWRDTNMATYEEVASVVEGKSPRIQR